jgi:hypothetical protein
MIKTELLLHLIVVHPKALAAVTDGGEFRTDSNDAGDKKATTYYEVPLTAFLFSVIKSLQIYCLLAW